MIDPCNSDPKKEVNESNTISQRCGFDSVGARIEVEVEGRTDAPESSQRSRRNKCKANTINQTRLVKEVVLIPWELASKSKEGPPMPQRVRGTRELAMKSKEQEHTRSVRTEERSQQSRHDLYEK
jgi:hypothetical protein